MRLSSIALIVACVGLTACGGSLRDSRINPANWFGSSTSYAVEGEQVVTASGEVVEVNPLIGAKKQSQLISAKNKSKGAGSIRDLKKKEGPYPGTLVDQVTALDITRTTTGALVSVVGVSSRQGAFDVRLVPANNGVPVNGVLTYELRAIQPIQTAQGPEQTRRLKVATALSVQDLESVRTVRVVGKRNVRTSRR